MVMSYLLRDKLNEIIHIIEHWQQHIERGVLSWSFSIK